MIPLTYLSFKSYPCIVWVFPELVCPYAIIVPLKPYRIFFRTGKPTWSNTCSCVESISKMQSYIKLISSFLSLFWFWLLWLDGFLIINCVCLFAIRWSFYEFFYIYFLLNGRNRQNTFILPSFFTCNYILYFTCNYILLIFKN